MKNEDQETPDIFEEYYGHHSWYRLWRALPGGLRFYMWSLLAILLAMFVGAGFGWIMAKGSLGYDDMGKIAYTGGDGAGMDAMFGAFVLGVPMGLLCMFAWMGRDR
jgi:hypothetical protein